jgi:Transglutaminase-like superfamily
VRGASAAHLTLMSRPAYFLRQHAHICCTGSHWMILDVQKDRYVSVDSDSFAALFPWLSAAGTPSTSVVQGTPPPEALALAQDLVAEDILTTEHRKGKDVHSSNIPQASAVLVPRNLWMPHRSCIRFAPAFFWSCMIAGRKLAHRSFEHNVRTVSTRKARRKTGSTHWPRARQLVAVFNTLRLFYPREYLCMFDSLALIEFLAHYDLFPNWIFGVMTDPFCAHCWVQAQNVVLNDTLDRVSEYTPIMAV